MKIQRLEYSDREYNWHLEPVEFSPNITLSIGLDKNYIQQIRGL